MSLLRLRIVGVVMRTYIEVVPMFLCPLPAAIDVFLSSDDDDIISPSQVDSGSSFAASMRSPMGGTRDPAG